MIKYSSLWYPPVLDDFSCCSREEEEKDFGEGERSPVGVLVKLQSSAYSILCIIICSLQLYKNAIKFYSDLNDDSYLAALL